MTESIDKPEPILLKKWQMLNAALCDKNLSKGDVAIQYQILDRYSVINGSCWPSFKRLASDTGLSQRMVQKSVKKLTAMGYVAIVKHGDRVSSNHYRPDFSLLDRVENASSLPNDEVENASSVCREPQFLKVENHSSLKPINEPEHKARGELVGLSANATSAASLATPLGGLPLASKVKDKYSDFWDVYPMRKHVSKTEDEITAMLSNGVLLSDIVEGARLYAEHIKVKQATWKGDKDYTIQPQNFIAKERWRDDWTITPKPEVKPKVVIDEKEPVKIKRKKREPLDAKNPFKNDYDIACDRFTEHLKKFDCVECKKRGKLKNQSITYKRICDVGRELLTKSNELMKKYQQWNDDNRDEWLKENKY